MKKQVMAVLLSGCMMASMLGILPGKVEATTSQTAAAPVSDWGAHTYVAADGEKVVTALNPLANGGMEVSGNQVIGGEGIGATYTKPLYLDQSGFSLNFNLDQYDQQSKDKWFAVALMDRATVTNDKNTDPVYKQWDNSDAKKASEGRGLVIIMRPNGNGWITFQLFYYGVTSNTDATAADNGYIYVGDGSYDNIKLNSGNYKNVKLDFVKLKDGGYNIVFNEGAYTRVDGSGNPGTRVDSNNEINPAVKLNLVDQIFPTGKPAYLQMVAYNAADYDTKFTINSVNGSYGNTANTLDSWGVHNYVAGDGSQLANEIKADTQGDVVVSGNQAAGSGELGVTYARPVDMANGFSIDFSLDKYKTNGVSGVDSWISLQISNKMQVTDANNTSPVYQKMDAGSGNPAYGSGLVMLIRPLANNEISIGEIFWNGVKFAADNTPSIEKNWEGDANGCYSNIKLDSFNHIKIAFVPNGDGFFIKINDGNFTRVGGDRVDSNGEINPANSYTKLRKLFNQSTPAYVSLVYHHNVNDAEVQFTVNSFNGQQAAPNALESWGAHNYTCISGPAITTDIAADANGGLTVSGYQTAGDGGIGATWLRPIDMANGCSVDFSLDNYRLNGSGNDTFIALQLMDKAQITDANNTDPVYRQFESNGDPTYGSGLVMLIRPLADNTLGIGEIYWNGVKFTPQVSKESNFSKDSNGCYDQIKVSSFSHIKIAFVPSANGSFNIVFNDGDYVRVGSDRQADDHGKINVQNGYSDLSKLFSNHNAAYLAMVYKDSTGQDAQFTINKVNGLNAVPAKSDTKDEVANGVYELFRDTKFANGFKVTGMDSLTQGSQAPYSFNYGDSKLRPTWMLAQWDSKYDFRDENVTLFSSPSDGVYTYENASKVITADTNTGELDLRLNASAVYSSPRAAGERWPHLLISDEGLLSGSANKFALKLKNAQHLRLQMSQKLSVFEDHMNGQADSSLHAASMYIYLYIKGTNEKGQTEMTWFGVPLFDNRYPYPSEYAAQDSGKSDASGLFVYNVPAKAYTTTTFHKNGTPVGSDKNAWMNIDIDLMPYVQRALYLANQSGYMKGVTMDTVFLDGMNLGWEMPGTYDTEMKIKNLSLKSYVGTDYENTTGIFNMAVSGMADQEVLKADANLAVTVPKDVLQVDNIENSILTLQAKKRASVSGVKAGIGKVESVYDTSLILNGNTYSYAYDKPVELKYTPDSALLASAGNDASKLKFYALSADGSSKEMTGTFDSKTKSFTFSVTKLSSFAVVNTAATSASSNTDTHTNPGTGVQTAVIPAIAAAAGAAVLVAARKRRKTVR